MWDKTEEFDEDGYRFLRWTLETEQGNLQVIATRFGVQIVGNSPPLKDCDSFFRVYHEAFGALGSLK